MRRIGWPRSGVQGEGLHLHSGQSRRIASMLRADRIGIAKGQEGSGETGWVGR
ncbi:hypothetical protein D8I24_3138 (plasmid) [Cupriavidus necator H850]|nr:hypothetical protein D8I24_3138 [Cupriavidus necator H850]